VVGLVVKAPLANDQVRTRVFALLDHVIELVLLDLVELFLVLSRFDFEFVFGLGFGWFEGTGQDGDLAVVDVALHLGVA